MAIHRATGRSAARVRPRGCDGGGHRSATVGPCLGAAMVYLQLALGQQAEDGAPLQHRAEGARLLCGLSRALAGRRPWVDAEHAEVDADHKTSRWAASR